MSDVLFSEWTDGAVCSDYERFVKFGWDLA